MSDRQRRVSGFAFVVGILTGLLLIGAGAGARAAIGASPPEVAKRSR
jgi:hypothetical protein